MNKIYMSLGLCLILSLGLVSAMSVDNVETSYDKKSKVVTIDYDLTLNQECALAEISILDKKGNVIDGSFISEFSFCKIIFPGGVIMDFSLTGTYHKSYTFELDEKPKGNKLSYKISQYYTDEVLAEDLITNAKHKKLRRLN